MSCLGKDYNPVPPRVWSRVENPCLFFQTNSRVPPVNAYDVQMMNKGNVLQYKKNSSNLTKSQRYAQIAKGMWTNNHVTWSAQSQNGYTNPNTNALQRVGGSRAFLSSGIPTDLLVTCPYSYESTPFDQIVIAVGGHLVCNTIENPCTGDVTVIPHRSGFNPSSNSGVPGPIVPLYWKDGTQTWYPKQRLTMTNSGNKFPQGYKFNQRILI